MPSNGGEGPRSIATRLLAPPPVDLRWFGRHRVPEGGDTPWASVPNCREHLPPRTRHVPMGATLDPPSRSVRGVCRGRRPWAPHRGGVRDDIAAPSSTNQAPLGRPPSAHCTQLRRRCGGARGQDRLACPVFAMVAQGSPAPGRTGSPGRQITRPGGAGMPVPTTNRPGLDASRTRTWRRPADAALRFRPRSASPSGAARTRDWLPARRFGARAAGGSPAGASWGLFLQGAWLGPACSGCDFISEPQMGGGPTGNFSPRGPVHRYPAATSDDGASWYSVGWGSVTGRAFQVGEMASRRSTRACLSRGTRVAVAATSRGEGCACRFRSRADRLSEVAAAASGRERGGEWRVRVAAWCTCRQLCGLGPFAPCELSPQNTGPARFQARAVACGHPPEPGPGVRQPQRAVWCACLAPVSCGSSLVFIA